MTRKEIQWINRNLPLKDFLDELNVEIPQNGVIFCPWHDNKETPAAKYYSDSNKVWCFADQKMYGAYDAMKLLGFDEDKIKSYVPEDISGFEEEKVVMKMPVVSLDLKQLPFPEYLHALNSLWVNRSNVECTNIE